MLQRSSLNTRDNQLDNPMRLAAVKKDIARIKTIIREKETNI